MGIITTYRRKNFLFICILLDFFCAIRTDKYEPVSHVIFDLDGLLVDTETIYYNSGCQLCARYGKTCTKDIKRKIMGTTELRAAEIIIKELNLPITPQDYLKQLNKLVERRFTETDIMPGTEKLMMHLHRNNISFAVSTGSSQEMYLLKIQKNKKLFSLVDHVTSASSDADVKQGKPAPDVFLVCAKRFKDQPDPSKCLVFEDSPLGVTAALRAGMQVVMVPDRKFIKDDDSKQNATLVLKSLEDFCPEWFGLPSYSA